MTSPVAASAAGAFRADPQALRAASRRFAAEVTPINRVATDAEQLQGTGGTAGRYYAAQGSAYHAAMLSFVQALLTPMATKATWVSDTLTSTAAHYAAQDTAAGQGITAAGQGA